MATQNEILEGVRRGLITEEQAKKMLGQQQPLPELPQLGGGLPEPAQQRGPVGALGAAGQAVSRLTGGELGLPPQQFVGIRRSVDESVPGLGRVAAAAAETGTQVLEGIGAPIVAGASLLGDVLAGATGTQPEQARRSMLAMTEVPFSGVPGVPGGARATVARRAAPDASGGRAQDIIGAGTQQGVPVMTTDVFQPQTSAGKLARATQQNVPLGLGTAPVRAAQQRAREGAVENLISEFDVGLDTPLEQQIIAGLSETQKANMSKAVNLRTDAVSSLKEFGEVPTSSARSEIANQIAREERLGARANRDVINLLKNTDQALSGDFELIKDVRTRVINDIKQLQKGDLEVLGGEAESKLQAVKSAIDKDLLDFAKENDRVAAGKWLQSNRLFADEFTKFRNSELRRVLAKGDITPEAVAPILRGGKVSELNRLASNSGPKGRSAARAAIIRDAVAKSGSFTNINPDRLVTELQRPATQRAISAFFKGDDKKRLDGFVKLLDATREAQRASVTTPTGQQLIGVAATGGAIIDPVATFFTATGIGAAGRAYESKAFRNMLLRAANTPKDTRQFRELANNFGNALNQAIAATQAQQADE